MEIAGATGSDFSDYAVRLPGFVEPSPRRAGRRTLPRPRMWDARRWPRAPRDTAVAQEMSVELGTKTW